MKTFSLCHWESSLREAVQILHEGLPAIRHVSIPPETLKDNIRTAKQILAELETLTSDYVFANKNEEIIFYKEVKPAFVSALHYWRWRLQFLLHAPEQDPRGLKKYRKQKIKEIRRFLVRHQEMTAYLRGGYNHFDEYYFVQNRCGLAAKIYAAEMLLAFLQEPKTNSTKSADLQWTGTRAGLVELIYALQGAGVLNHGQASLVELVHFFEAGFQTTIPNFYHTFNEIRLRKKNRTMLLDTLREKMIQRMDRLDES